MWQNQMKVTSPELHSRNGKELFCITKPTIKNSPKLPKPKISQDTKVTVLKLSHKREILVS
jgi:hypothetical protein